MPKTIHNACQVQRTDIFITSRRYLLHHSLSRVVVPATLHSISVNAHFTRFSIRFLNCYRVVAILYPELSFLLRYTPSLSTPILQDFPIRFLNYCRVVVFSVFLFVYILLSWLMYLYLVPILT